MDLVLIKEPDLIDEGQNLGIFASSDHRLLYWSMNVGQLQVDKEQDLIMLEWTQEVLKQNLSGVIGIKL